MKILSRGIKFLLAPDDDSGGGGEVVEKVTAADVVVPKSEASKAFFERFSAKKNAPVHDGGDPNSDKNQQAIEQSAADEQRIAAEREKQKADAAKASDTSKEPPFLKKQIERARAAEQERDQAKSEAEALKASIAEKEKAVADLQSKIDSGDFSPKKESEMQARIQEIERKSQEERESLVNENKRIQSRLSFYDLNEDPEFQNTYLTPVRESYKSAREIIGHKEENLKLFESALLANAAALRANKSEDRARAEQQRDEILSRIAEELPQFSGGRFVSAVNDYITASHKHAKALQEHEKTAGEIRAKATEFKNKEYANRLESWQKTYKVTAEKYDPDVKMSEDEIKIAKRLGLDPEKEIAAIEHIASKTIVGETSMAEAVDLIHKGRAYPSISAKLKVLQHELKERDALITKLRGGKLPDGDSGGNGGTPPAQEKKSRDEWQKQFSPSRLA